MSFKRVLCYIMPFTFVASTVCLADSGTWVKQEDFAQLNVFCQRLYICRPDQDILIGSGSKLVTTPATTVRGVCSAGSGPTDSCNECLTNPPSQSCEYHIEAK